MSRQNEKVIDALRKLNAVGEEVVMSGYVKSVDEEKATMVVVLNGTDPVIEIEDVMLHALEGELKGIIIIPEIDSDVTITSVDGAGEYILHKASKIAKVLLDVGDIVCKVTNKATLEIPEIEITAETSIKVSCPDIVFNDGNNNGLVKVAELTAKLNTVEQDLNSLKQALQAVIGGAPIPEPGSGAPSALQVALAAGLGSYYGQTITETQQADIENTEIKH